MKRMKKTVFFVLFAAFSFSVYGQNIDAFTKALDSSAETLEKGLIAGSALGLNWADAYIGQLIGVPPHFGIGISLGATGLNTDNLDPIFKQFGTSAKAVIDTPVGFPLPGAAVEARIGGFFLPFDIGLKAMVLPELGSDTKIKYTMIGGDVRYALLKEGLVVPALSVGLGLTYTNIGITTGSLGSSQQIDLSSLPGYSAGEKVAIAAPKMEFGLANTTLDLKVQVSKKFFIVTPFLGLGLSYGWSSLDFKANSAVSYSGGPHAGSYLNDIKNATGIDVSTAGLGKSYSYGGLGARVFGGASVNIFVMRINLTGIYDFVNQSWSAGLGLRFQL